MGDSFDDAVRAFTDLKAFEGMSVVNDCEPDDINPCRISEILAAASPSRSPIRSLGNADCDTIVSRYARIVAAWRPQCGTPHSGYTAIVLKPTAPRAPRSGLSSALPVAVPPSPQAWDVVTYFFFRRWVTKNGLEALPALLEDVHTYHDLKVPSSRLKWARAIIAAVDAEKGCSDILAALVSQADDSATASTAQGDARGSDMNVLSAVLKPTHHSGLGVHSSPSSTPGGSSSSSSGHNHRTSHSGSVSTSASASSSTTYFSAVSVSSSPGGSRAVLYGGDNIASVWDSVRATVASAAAAAPSANGATSPSLLPDRLFDVPYAFVACALRSRYTAAFLASRDAAAYADIVAALPAAQDEAAISASAQYAAGSAPPSRAAYGGSVVATAASASSMSVSPAGFDGHTAVGASKHADGANPPLFSHLGPARLVAANTVVMRQSMFDRLGCIGQVRVGALGECVVGGASCLISTATVLSD